jgi:pimeloyl-ACP methyl ester carboxylesterase
MIVSLPGDPQSIHPRLRSATLNDLADWLFGRDPESEAAKSEASKIDPQAIQLTLVEAQSLLADQWIRELSIPCLMVHGLSDPLINPSPQDLSGPLSQYIHQIIFEQSGHYPMLDEPAKFNRLIADFLALPSGTSPNQLQIKEEWKRRIR